MIRDCSVCTAQVSKYKCSKCFTPYCSLSCWKKHEVECQGRSNEVAESAHTLENERLIGNLVTEDTVPSEKLELLEKSEHLMKMLQNHHLQKILSGVDQSVNPSEAIHKAMTEPSFLEFTDECLKIIEGEANEMK